ncbi:Polymerase/histidinol phosphatase-like protein [Diplogelasinospora grovesii]|uniref:Histidinol-phosphatase n=1 Tax=Diplogelasinospora grovesii TaxID=303347 RepID=A0AAN6N1U3_9PEZI|nr:Polymerase/histidinol phosphatase-like protein [Diplogelasinospora grovesii]
MAFTMHSHSGQFCPGHAKDQLEDIIKHAIKMGYKTMGLTEHMPRTELSDLYPEELTPDPNASLAALMPRHEAYLAEAWRLQIKYADRIHILIGFEGEWIRKASYGPLVKQLAAHPHVDYFIGSLHHTSGVPIDLDRATYHDARDRSGGTEEWLYEKYYDEQYEMLCTLRPKIVGHFDLVRLLSSDPGRDISKKESWTVGRKVVWEKAQRNLRFVRGYGGWLECNTSALRKGLAEPYPARPIAEAWVKLGGRWTMSDDSHGVEQVATNYERGLQYLESLGVREVWTLERALHPELNTTPEKAPLKEKSVSIAEIMYAAAY